MYQVSKLQMISPDEVGNAPSPAPDELLDSVILFIRRRYVIICLIIVLALALGFAYALFTPKSFTASAELIVDGRKAFDQPADLPIDSTQIESLVQIVKSENVMAIVVKDLHLDTDPEFVGSPGGGAIGSIRALIGLTEPPPPDQRQQMRKATFELQKGLEVARVGVSRVLEISFTSRDPEKAARIVNATTNAFMAEQVDVENQANRRANGWLLDRLKQLGDQADAAERAVVAFKQSNNIVSVSGGHLDDQKLAALTAQLSAAREKTTAAQARSDRINAIIASEATANPVNIATIDDFSDPATSKLRQQYLELASREKDWAKKYGSDHLVVVELQNQMRDIRTSILTEIRRLAETYKGEYQIAKQAEGAIAKELDETIAETQAANRAQVSLEELESTAQSYRTLYQSFLKRSTEASQADSFPISAARVITPATAPLEKSRPKTFLVLFLAGIGGVVSGVGLGLLRDLRDQVFRTAAQVESHLQMPCAALVPRARIAKTKSPSAERRHLGDGAFRDRRLISLQDQASWLPTMHPTNGRFAEALRSVKLALDTSAGNSERSKVVGFTSAFPREGKSTISMAFGLESSLAGSRVVVVDLDLRNPTLSRAMAPSANADILDVLAGHCVLDDAIWVEPKSNMAFLPGSIKVRMPNSSEILRSAPMKYLFDELRRRYEYVVVDLPPLAPVVDARATTKIIDGYFLVVGWGSTRIRPAVRAIAAAKEMRNGFLGAVLNRADIALMGKHDADSRAYYQNPDYSAYGIIE